MVANDELTITYGDLRLQIRTIINDVYKKDRQCKSPNDILLKSVQMDIIRAYHKFALMRMRIGILWERIFCLFGYDKLPKGGDIINHDKKVIIELKNAKSSDNKSSRTEDTRKLIQYGQPGYQLIYGVINDKKSKDENMVYEGTTYRLLTGPLLLEFILGDKWQDIIKIIQNEFNASVGVKFT